MFRNIMNNYYNPLLIYFKMSIYIDIAEIDRKNVKQRKNSIASYIGTINISPKILRNLSNNITQTNRFLVKMIKIIF